MSRTRTTGAHRAARSSSACVYWNGTRVAPDGWSGIDDVGPVELVEAGLPVETGSASHLYVGPAIGQIDTWNLPVVLEEFRRILGCGGTIRISAYDAEASIDAYQRGDAAFFWDQSSSLAAGFTAQLLDFGAARSLFTGDLLVDLLRDAGFADVSPAVAGASMNARSGLAALDEFDRQCCYAEAVNPAPWPSAAEVEGPSAIHLGWGDQLGRTAEVIWSGPARSSGTLAYRPVGSARWHEVAAVPRPTPDGRDGRHVFRARTDVLDPGSRYEYEVRQEVAGRVVLDGASFSAPPADPTVPVRLGFLADTGVSGRVDGLSDGVEAVVREMDRLDPHVVLGGGDYAYRSSDARWATPQQAVHGWLEQMVPLLSRRPFMAQHGNHEVSLGERYREWAVHLPAPTGEGEDRRSFSFDLGPCHVAAFYAPDGDIDPAELGWLCADLATSRARRHDAWLIVFQHQPLVAHGSSHPADPKVQRALSSVLQANRVDLHLSAHDQNYERTFPLVWNSGRPIAASTDPNRYRHGEGVVLAKVSPSGKRSDRGGGFSALRGPVDGLVAKADDTAHHLALIRATTDRLTLETHALRVGEPTELIDRVEVVR